MVWCKDNQAKNALHKVVTFVSPCFIVYSSRRKMSHINLWSLMNSILFHMKFVSRVVFKVNDKMIMTGVILDRYGPKLISPTNFYSRAPIQNLISIRLAVSKMEHGRTGTTFPLCFHLRTTGKVRIQTKIMQEYVTQVL